jgi:2'-5' RNA ligase
LLDARFARSFGGAGAHNTSATIDRSDARILAVAIAAELRDRISAVQQQLKDLVAAGPGRRVRVTWVKPETIHLTIKFLGEIGEAALNHCVRVSALRSTPARDRDPAWDRWCISAPPGAEGSVDRSAFQWDSLDEAKGALELAARIDAVCEKFAVPRDAHPWRPHLTVARVRKGSATPVARSRRAELTTRTHDMEFLTRRNLTDEKRDAARRARSHAAVDGRCCQMKSPRHTLRPCAALSYWPYQSFSQSLSFTVASPGAQTVAPARNVIVITIDGLRWQEFFGGADREYFKRDRNGSGGEPERRFWRDSPGDRRSL